MNERIKELAEQAGIKINARRPALDDEPNGYHESDNDFMGNNYEVVIELLEGDSLKKFAELIVRECVEIAKDVNRNPYLDERYHAGQIINHILKRFGVE